MHFHFGDQLVVGGLHEEHFLSLERGKSEVAAISKVLTVDARSGQVSGGQRQQQRRLYSNTYEWRNSRIRGGESRTTMLFYGGVVP